jgi:hypothetical protein
MNKGDTVTIYEDPLDCMRPEGKAVLINRQAGADQCGWYNTMPIERWFVRFEGPEETEVLRTIVAPKVKTERG